MATLSSQLNRLDAGQLATVTYLSGIDANGNVSSASYDGYVAGVTNAANPGAKPVTASEWTWQTALQTGATVTYNFLASSAGYAFTAVEQDFATQVLQMWSGMSGIKFVFKNPNETAQVNFVHSGDTLTGLGTIGNGTLWQGGAGNTTATPGLVKIKNGAVHIDATAQGLLDFGSISDYRAHNGYGVDTLVHEVGHLLGLGHAGPYNYVTGGPSTFGASQRSATDETVWTAMSYISPSSTDATKTGSYGPDATAASWANEQPFSPMSLDIFAAQRLYGGPASDMFAGGKTFGFNSTVMYTKLDGTQARLSMYDFTQPSASAAATDPIRTDYKPVVTLFDTGAKNTLDLSGFTTSNTVNLNDGTFSSVDGLVSNIFIEYGTQIDTLVGGSGNDVITANERSDVIDGGAGLDTVKVSGARSAYTVAFAGPATILTNTATGIAYRLTNVETVQFGAGTAVALADLTRANWSGPANARFGVATNWSNGQAPTSTSQLQIYTGATITATSQDTNDTDTLAMGSGSTIDIQSGRLTLRNVSAGSYNAGTIGVETGATLSLAGGLANSGTLALFGGALQTASAQATLSGGGTVAMQDGRIGGRASSPLDTLTNVDDVITGTGTIGASGALSAISFHNAANGNVLANSGTLAVTGTTVNDGIMGASDNGVLDLLGSIDQSTGGRIVALGTNARVLLDGGTITGGYITNATGVIEVAANETLNGVTLLGTIKVDAGKKLTLIGDIAADGATIDASAGQIDMTQAHLRGGTLILPTGGNTDGLVLDGGFSTIGLSTPLSSVNLTVRGGITNASVISVVGHSSPYAIDSRTGYLRVSGTTVLNGGGTLNMVDYNAKSSGTQVVTGTADDTLDNVSNLITGYGQLGNGIIGIINRAQGNIVVTESTMVISTGALGLINAGVIKAQGGTIDLVGTVTNTGGKIAADASTINLKSALLTGGQLTTIGTGLIDASGTSGLADLASTATITVDRGSTLGLTGTLTNGGTLTLHGYGSDYGVDFHPGTLALHGAVILDGGGNINLVDDYGHAATGAQIIGGTATDSLENKDNAISGYGIIGAGQSGFTNDASGKVTATGGTLRLDSGTPGIFNQGLMQAIAGTLEISSTIANTGRIQALTGGTVILHKQLAYSGSVVVGDGGTFVFDGGSEQGSGGFTTAANSDVVVTSSGVLDGTAQTVTLGGRTRANGGTTFTLAGQIANAGVMTIHGYGSDYGVDFRSSTLTVKGTTTLSGGGTLQLVDDYGHTATGAQIVTGVVGSVLDLKDQTIQGYGTIGAGKVTLVIEAPSAIRAQGGTIILDSGAGSITNAGLITAVQGSLQLNTATANTGRIVAGAAGILTERGAITGTGTVTVAAGGRLNFESGSIAAAGTLTSAANAAIWVNSTASLDGTQHALSLAGTTDIEAGATLTLSGTVTNTGAMTLHGTSYYYNQQRGTIAVTGKVVLNGGGTLSMLDYQTAAGSLQSITGTAADTFENADNTISGYGFITGMKIVNDAAATITAQTGRLTLDSGTAGITNAGTLRATSGTLELHGAIANTGGTIAAAGGMLELQNATITGGTLSSSGAGVEHVTGTLALTSAATTGTMLVDGGATLALTGRIANSGTINIRGSSYYYSQQLSTVKVNGAVLLTGGGTVTMADTNNSDLYFQTFTGTSAADTLDNLDNTISGHGRIGQGHMSLVNEAAGTIAATSGAITIDTGAGTLTNRGRLLADGGALNIKSAMTNTGMVEARNGAVTIDKIVTGGTLQLGAAGTMTLASGLQNTAVTFSGVGGTLNVAAGQPVLATVTGFTDGDTIDLAGVTATGSYVGGVLTLMNGATTLGSLTMAGVGVNDRYATQSDGHGGTKIVHQVATPAPDAVRFSNIATSSAGADTPIVYGGPVTYLEHQYIWSSPDAVAIAANQPNTFLKGGPAGDALLVQGGQNVLDGGGGSNFLIGANGADGGKDVFFVDSRGGVETWSTIVNFHKGDLATIFGFHQGTSTRPYTDNDGAAGYTGITIHSEIDGPGTGIKGSMTFTGIDRATADAHFELTTGTLPGNIDYLLIEYK